MKQWGTPSNALLRGSLPPPVGPSLESEGGAEMAEPTMPTTCFVFATIPKAGTQIQS